MDKLQEFMQTAKLSDYIDLMVKALENPKIKISMMTYGKSYNGICFGCAATNALCEFSGKIFDETNIDQRTERAQFLGYDVMDVRDFERIIDSLRQGDIQNTAIMFSKARPNYIYPYLTMLTSFYTLEDLIPFKELSTKLKQDGL
ncbi:MAG: hypothetical protein IT245_07010 [Bacteroidia bacterium]|nr:hypothetical protein [Bacteroidia bacterium]